MSDIVLPAPADSGPGYCSVDLSSGIFQLFCQRLREVAVRMANDSLADDCDYAIQVKYLDTLHFNHAEFAALLEVTHQAQPPSEVLHWEFEAYIKSFPPFIKACQEQGITVEEQIRRIRLNTRIQMAKVKELVRQHLQTVLSIDC